MTTAPIPKPIPTSVDGFSSRAIGSVSADSPLILVHEAALESILTFSERDMRRETGGFLLGGFHEDQREYVEVRHFLPATKTRSHSASLTFTHETWSQLNHDIEQHYPDEMLVGWQHTHPGLGVFLSNHDLFIHRHFFDRSYQIAMVVDPQQSEFCFFQWTNDDIVDCGFVCVSPRRSQVSPSI